MNSSAVLDSGIAGPTVMLDRRLGGRKAWQRDTISPNDWLLPIPAGCLAEIDAVVKTLRRNPMATLVLTPRDFSLDACRRLMKGVKARLDRGVGFCVLDRLPVDHYSKDEMTAVYWLLSALIARPVAQSYVGTLLYDVFDFGKKIEVRSRGDLTRLELTWHTDYGFNYPPPYIGLLVLRTAKTGGRSYMISLASVHNELRRRCPDLLARLYRPFYWNRQGEHPVDDPIVNFNPVFRYDGRRLLGRINRRLLHVGYQLMNEPMDAAGEAALEALYTIMNEPHLYTTFELQPGQLQYINNAACAHQRTEYEDYDDPDRKRHLVRIFLRDEGARSYMGCETEG